MTLPLFVSNSSPIIAFEHLDLLDLLRHLTNALYVPPAVREVFAKRTMPSWITERAVSYPTSPRILQPRLGLGESEAISLALEMLPCYLVVDDLAARRAAQVLKIPVVGTVNADEAGYILFLPKIPPDLPLRKGGEILLVHLSVSQVLTRSPFRMRGEAEALPRQEREKTGRREDRLQGRLQKFRT